MHSTNARFDIGNADTPSAENSLHQIRHDGLAHRMQRKDYSAERNLARPKFKERQLLKGYFGKVLAEMPLLVRHLEQSCQSPEKAVWSDSRQIETEGIKHSSFHLQNLKGCRQILYCLK
jgi:hypothetical protein